MKKLAILATSAMGLAAMALAETLPEIADADGSGTWSLTELQTVFTEMTEATFATLDTNGDGSVDAAELSAAIEAGVLTVPAQ